MKKTHSIILSAAFVFAGLAENARGSVLVVSDATRGFITPSSDSGPAIAGGNYRAGFCPLLPEAAGAVPRSFATTSRSLFPYWTGPSSPRC